MQKSLYLDELEDNLNLTVLELVVNHPVCMVQPILEMRRSIPKTLAKNILNRSVSMIYQ